MTKEQARGLLTIVQMILVDIMVDYKRSLSPGGRAVLNAINDLLAYVPGLPVYHPLKDSTLNWVWDIRKAMTDIMGQQQANKEEQTNEKES